MTQKFKLYFHKPCNGSVLSCLGDRLAPAHAVQHAAAGAPAFPFCQVQKSVG